MKAKFRGMIGTILWLLGLYLLVETQWIAGIFSVMLGLFFVIPRKGRRYKGYNWDDDHHVHSADDSSDSWDYADSGGSDD